MKKKNLVCIILSFAMCISLCSCSLSNSLEKQAKKHLKQLEDYRDIDEAQDVVAVAFETDEKTMEFGFIFICDYDDMEYLEKGKYYGNGSNGGEASDNDIPFYNIRSLSQQKSYLEFLMGLSSAITYEDAIENKKEGIILIDVDKVL